MFQSVAPLNSNPAMQESCASSHFAFPPGMPPQTGGESFCALVAGMLRGARCSLLMTDADGRMTLEDAVGLPPQASAGGPVRLGERVARRVARTGAPLIVNDVTELGDIPMTLGSYGSQSFLSYPFSLADGSIGVINVTERVANDPFGASDVDMLSHLSAFFVATGSASASRRISAQRQERKHEIQIQENERKRIARDLHDEAGHRITAAILRLDMATELCVDNPAIRRELDAVRLLLADCVDGLHETMFSLRPQILADLGLVPAVRSLLRRVQEATRIKIHLLVDGELKRLEEGPALAAFRVVQEAVTNALKHSNAAYMVVRIMDREPHLVVEVTDDGVGFDPSAQDFSTRARLGLKGMKERADLAGGFVEVQTRPGQGATIRAEFPMREVTA